MINDPGYKLIVGFGTLGRHVNIPLSVQGHKTLLQHPLKVKDEAVV